MPGTDTRLEPLQVLPDSECVLLLRANDLGRIGLVDRDARPLIFPVNYFFEDGVIAFRTSPGSKLELAPGAEVCFEVDGWDEETRIGWSVLVKGVAHDITHPRGMPTGRMHFLPVHPRAPGRREHWIGIWTREISGRRFRSGPAAGR